MIAHKNPAAAGQPNFREPRCVPDAACRGTVTTEIEKAGELCFAEPIQPYLGTNPGAYRGVGGTGVSWPVGLARS